MLKENLTSVENQIQTACERSGRDRKDVTLIAVSKTKPVETLEEAYNLGVRVFGENKVQELADKYEVDIMTMTGFLDGINDSLKTPNPIEEMEEDTEVSLGFDKELLYKNMVAAGADWLYDLPEWEAIFDEDTRKALYKEQKSSTTIVKPAKVYPNDPCPCGSGKKYKKCCGKNK